MGGRTKKICPPLHCITKMAGKKWREKGGGGRKICLTLHGVIKMTGKKGGEKEGGGGWGERKNMSNLAWCYKPGRRRGD